ncbi:heterokaryon incompatibility protein-domain-containing protein [Scleroderma citrinum]
MRLLNTHTQRLEEFSQKPPAYAILSHRWRNEEVQFHDLESARSMPCYNKIRHCCDQARQDGLEYVWIDTCCIDKGSSAILSESLNSMFAWYRAAYVCYAYLQDVDSDGDPSEEGASFEESEWFNRGWTLQELLAPETLYFFAKDWTMIGSKISLASTIARITGIHKDALLYPERLYLFSIATRMSWAARRQTTKEEDRAYSLMGIFDVHMPIIYGEGGKKAFSRLQREIIKASNDQSILAWRTHISGRRLQASTPLGPLAESPVSFSRSGTIHPISLNKWTQYCVGTDQVHLQGTTLRLEFSMTNNGLNITLPLRELETPKDTFEAVLCCCTVRIYLKNPHVQHYERTLDLDFKGEIKSRTPFVLKDIHLGLSQPTTASTSQKGNSPPNFVVQYIGVSESGFVPQEVVASRCIIVRSKGTILLRMERHLEPEECLRVAKITLRRSSDGECFTVGVGASSAKTGGGPWVYAMKGDLDERVGGNARSKMDWAKLTLSTREVVNVTMRKMNSSNAYRGREYKVTLTIQRPTLTSLRPSYTL